MAEGRHVKYWVLNSPFELLKDVEAIRGFLERLVVKAGMRPLADAIVFDIRKTLLEQGMQPYEDEPEGVSGICVLSTSHAAIHTNPHRKYGVIDLYSCRDFDPDALEVFIREELRGETKAFDVTYSLEGLEDMKIVCPP